MKHLNPISAFFSGLAFQMKSHEGREKIRVKRLKQLVGYAKTNSTYYQKLYSHVGEDFKLNDLPITNKLELMENFDSWLTDSDVKLNDIYRYMENKDNVGRYYQDKYLCFTTSGSTGNVAVVLYDKTAHSVMKGITTLRSLARNRDKVMFFLRGSRSAGVYSGGHFYYSEASIRNLQLKSKSMAKRANFINILQPFPQVIDQLNELQPVVVASYTTVLTLLAEEQKSGRLKIKPTVIYAGGEYVDNKVLADIGKTFNCTAQSGYATSECGMIAFGCKKNRYHINEDWVIVEPVDKNNEPVAPGQRADKLLVTNLSNFIQPYIRYEIFDRNIYHEDRCECGNPSPWIEIEGRTDDILEFDTEHGKVHVIPLALQGVMKDIREISRFQFVLHDKKRLELRIISKDKNLYFEKAKALLNAYFESLNIDVEIYLSDEEPQNDKSGKFKHVIICEKNLTFME